MSGYTFSLSLYGNLETILLAVGAPKHVCDRSKRARHSALVQALDVTSAADYVKKSTISLYNRACAIHSPTRHLCIYFVNMFMPDNVGIPSTLVDRVLGLGYVH